LAAASLLVMNMKIIPLTQGKVALVDDEDFERASQLKWCAHHHVTDLTKWYATHSEFQYKINGRQFNIGLRLHRFILSVFDPAIEIDHIDHDGLNCQRHNLRIATRSQNQMNRRKINGCSSQFKGVYWHKRDRKWISQIKLDGIKQYIGRFDSELDAATAYDSVANSMFGNFALLNFNTGNSKSDTVTCNSNKF
jgi:hypothetical protein